MSQKLILALLAVVLAWLGPIAWPTYFSDSVRARFKVVWLCTLVAIMIVALTGCGDTINPVRYQAVPVLVTKPCLQGRTPPSEATVLTDPACGPGDAQCVINAAADITELKREAHEYRNLFKECSK